MANPQSWKAFQHKTGTPLTTLESVTEDVTSLKPNNVMARIRVVSLNCRDVSMQHGNCPTSVMDSNISYLRLRCQSPHSRNRGLWLHDRDPLAPVFNLKSIHATEEESSLVLE